MWRLEYGDERDDAEDAHACDMFIKYLVHWPISLSHLVLFVFCFLAMCIPNTEW